MAHRGINIRFVVIDEISAFAAPSEEPTYRGMEGDDQLIEVDNKWGYAWGGDKLLEVGDRVVLPSAARRRGATAWWIGTVTGYGSAWTGQHKRVMRLATAYDLERWAEIQEAKAMARPKRERYERRGS